MVTISKPWETKHMAIKNYLDTTVLVIQWVVCGNETPHTNKMYSRTSQRSNLKAEREALAIVCKLGVMVKNHKKKSYRVFPTKIFSHFVPTDLCPQVRRHLEIKDVLEVYQCPSLCFVIRYISHSTGFMRLCPGNTAYTLHYQAKTTQHVE